jgi:hypothetical protein
MKLHQSCLCIAGQLLIPSLLLVTLVLTVQGQTWTQYDQGTPPQHAAGVSPLGSYASTELGTVNLSNGALNIALPMGTVGGRGFSIPIGLNWSGKVWSVGHDTAWDSRLQTDVSMAYATYGAADTFEDLFNRVAPGWVTSGTPVMKTQGVGISPCNNGYSVYYLVKLTVVLPDKGEIELRDDQSDGAPFYTNCTGSVGYRGRRWHATGGSGVIFISDNDNGVTNGDLAGTLVTSDGMRYRFTTTGNIVSATSVTDRNGNQITINRYVDPNNSSHITTEYIDQLGRSTKVEQNALDPANQSITLALLVTLKGYQDSTQPNVSVLQGQDRSCGQSHTLGL